MARVNASTLSTCWSSAWTSRSLSDTTSARRAPESGQSCRCPISLPHCRHEWAGFFTAYSAGNRRSAYASSWLGSRTRIASSSAGGSNSVSSTQPSALTTIHRGGARCSSSHVAGFRARHRCATANAELLTSEITGVAPPKSVPCRLCHTSIWHHGPAPSPLNLKIAVKPGRQATNGCGMACTISESPGGSRQLHLPARRRQEERAPQTRTNSSQRPAEPNAARQLRRVEHLAALLAPLRRLALARLEELALRGRQRRKFLEPDHLDDRVARRAPDLFVVASLADLMLADLLARKLLRPPLGHEVQGPAQSDASLHHRGRRARRRDGRERAWIHTEPVDERRVLALEAKQPGVRRRDLLARLAKLQGFRQRPLDERRQCRALPAVRATQRRLPDVGGLNCVRELLLGPLSFDLRQLGLRKFSLARSRDDLTQFFRTSFEVVAIRRAAHVSLLTLLGCRTHRAARP